MGSWYATCAISNLHINEGEDVMAILLMDNKRDSFCYSTALYSPCIIPFYGKYNDYGKLTKCHGVGYSLIMEKLKEKLFEMEMGENEYHDIAVKKENFNEELFFDAINEDRLFIKNGSKQLKVSLIYIKMSVINKILSKARIETFVKDRIKDLTFNEVMSDFDKMMKIFRRIDCSKGSIFERHQLHCLEPGFNDTLSANLIYRAKNWEFQCNNALINFIPDIIGNLYEDPKFEDLLKEIATVCWLDTFLNSTRKVWCRPCGEGSQHTDGYNYRVLCKAIVNILDKEEKEIEEY